MSKKKNKCCCEKKCCCERKEQDVCCCEHSNPGMGFLGGGCGLAPIIFLLIACGSGLLNCSSSYLIILLFILFGGCLCGSGKGMGSCCC
ncbi:hypothetical protein [Clostridium saccharobutylicum]|uniref:Uncharacterized protein n=1 Tax=Clostridium saccharobutylicum DSM 13864 TaxID=1345695 RepID=U5MU79_CLOSA|nr:hypothetical protein [Clostridium saccharobutylicum]AGX44083.1 hypothetical protein CLSA_c31170 [Clostridium saccharobutylicum DSM 13864]AQR91373.1 hypothetical protein CLOSC_30980 [Clostridium saccharobutylicum]AQS01277.1 hypothetical protein CSACC_31050 [Clostridium saccharobutylicum]AQS10887.1 hypothetical protein CLOBY_30360 [Clostridium saccharobutylicum]AQS15260.1 hypothetical protein CLOSACC_31050 [Clostridium saccharobutylicum]